MHIGRFNLDDKVLVVAEIGNNHEGDASLAMEMVAAAAEAGADAVKVQVINPEKLVNRSQTERIAQLSAFQLPWSAFVEMASLAQNKGVLFLASAFDIQSLESIADLVSAIKIASGDLDFVPLLIKAASLNKPLLLSTGMGTLSEVRAAVKTIESRISSGSLYERLALLHCVSLYPTPLYAANLRAIQTLHQAFGLTVGYSDHTLGIEAAIMAMAMGARIIEKHFTLDKNRPFRDHAISSDPIDLRCLAKIAHNLDLILGSGEKVPSPEEQEVARTARRCIVASRDLPEGTRLGVNDLDYIRPREGLAPAAAIKLLGRKLVVSLKAHEIILESHLE
jgi:N,N'-diacetyllegionaminate synthase